MSNVSSACDCKHQGGQANCESLLKSEMRERLLVIDKQLVAVSGLTDLIEVLARNEPSFSKTNALLALGDTISASNNLALAQLEECFDLTKSE